MAEIIFRKGTAPPAPTEDEDITVYAKDDGLLYRKDSADLELPLAGAGSYTNEQAQDAIGTILNDTTSIAWTYDDTTPEITATVLDDSSIQKVEVVKNSGAILSTRKQLNFIEGSNITLTIADDAANGQADITIAAPVAGYTDEQAQDAVGAMLTDTNSIDFTYTDATPAVTADVKVRNTATANTSITVSGVGVDVNTDSSVQKIEVVKNSGAVVATRKQLNFIEGTNVTLTIADDGSNNQADITIAATGGGSYTDEEAQDAVGTILTDTATINFTYTDATPAIEADVITNSSVQKVEVVKNSGAVVGTRKQLNFIEGSNVTLTVADDAGNDQVDITIASVVGSGLSQDQVLNRLAFRA